jgi:uncharacterized protein YecT (DUF1311 family)
MLFAPGVGAFANPPRILLTSPMGTYRIEEPASEDIPRSENELESVTEFIVNVSNPEQRAPIPRANAQPVYDFAFSPDEKWFAVNVHYGSKLAGFRLYELKEGPKLERVLEEEPAWNWLDDSKLNGLSAADMMRHGGWSSDSSRLLLRTPIGGEAIAKGKPTANYFLYYNIRSRRFELSEYLRNVNRNTIRILRSKNPEQPIYEAEAEPMDPIPSIEINRARYEAADEKLNKVYASLIERLKEKAEEQTELRERQRNWIKVRDLGAEAFSAVRPKANRSAYRQHYLAEATESRAQTLEGYLSRLNEP